MQCFLRLDLHKSRFRCYIIPGNVFEKSFTPEKPMRIIAGSARNLELTAPPTLEVRPTAVRSRKALFDSIGEFGGLRVVDLFAGSGALALEAASRGASSIVLVEQNARHASAIEENILRVRRTGAEFAARVIRGDASDPLTVLAAAPADLLFADPPYAVSAQCFGKLMGSDRFKSAFAGTRIIWELPNTPGAAGEFLVLMPEDWELRRFGGTLFASGRLS